MMTTWGRIKYFLNDGGWTFVLIAMAVLIILLIILIVKNAAANKDKQDLLRKIDDSVEKLRGGVEQQTKAVETVTAFCMEKSDSGSVDEIIKPKTVHVVAIDNRVSGLRDVEPAKQPEKDSVKWIEEEPVEQDDFGYSKAGLEEWLKQIHSQTASEDRKPEGNSRFIKYEDRSCGIDRNGNVHTEEDLKEQIKF